MTESKVLLLEIISAMKKPAKFTVEPYGRHDALHIFADPIYDYDVDISDKNTIYFGAGTHEAGMIKLESNQTLFIDEGAVVYGCISAADSENIRIIGRGILDNSHNKEKILYSVNAEGNVAAVNNAERIHTVQLEYCTNVLIDGITIRDSLVYNIRPIGCKNLHINNIKAIGCWRYNSDGIDMHNCENVLIENCFLRTFDDSICIKGFDFFAGENIKQAIDEATYHNGSVYNRFTNAVIKKCTIWNDWGKCLEIGAETKAKEINNIVFEDCDIIHVTSQVLDCCNVDYAHVHDICFKNINIELNEVIPEPVLQINDQQTYASANTDYSPAVIEASVQYHAEYSAGSDERGKNSNIVYSDINIIGEKKPKAAFYGVDENHACENVMINNLLINGKPIASEDDLIKEVDEFCKNIKIQ